MVQSTPLLIRFSSLRLKAELKHCTALTHQMPVMAIFAIYLIYNVQLTRCFPALTPSSKPLNNKGAYTPHETRMFQSRMLELRIDR